MSVRNSGLKRITGEVRKRSKEEDKEVVLTKVSSGSSSSGSIGIICGFFGKKKFRKSVW